MRCKFGMVFIVIVMVFFWPDRASSTSSSDPSERWHVPSVPQVISEEVQFTNGDTRLSGTV